MKTAAKILALLSVSFCLVSCGGRQSPYKDGTSYDISFKQDGSVKATLHKITGGFNLTVSGSGRTKSFDSTSDVPWHYISKRIIDLKINEGVTVIGNSLFYSLDKVTGTVLPSTIAAIGRDAFNAETALFATTTNPIENSSDASIYTYKEEMPTESDVYWHYRNGVATVWSTIKIFFIGNSFTYFFDVPALTEALIKTSGEMVDVDYVVQGSAHLTDHANPETETGKKIVTMLNATKDYDYVILQEHSTTPASSYNNFKTGASKLASLVKTTQKHAKVRLYSTWGYESAATERSKTIPDFEKLLRDQYIKLANEVVTIDDVHFVGPAFSKVYTDYKNIPLYHTDDKHQSMYGAYLSACVHALSMIKDIVLDNTDFYGAKMQQYVDQYDPTAPTPKTYGDGISESDAKTLINIAKDTVASYSINEDDSENS